MKKIGIIILFISFYSCGFCNLKDSVNVNKLPNIILILMDDMGYGDLAVTGALNFQTPHLDKLASEGIRFTNFLVAQPICTASRAGLLTGCYPNRIGMFGAFGPNSEIGLNPDEITIPEMLKTKGYQTAMIGKWHLGDNIKFLPLQQGFDEFFGLPYSNDMWPLYFDGKPFPPGATDKMHIDAPLPLLEGNKTKEIIKDLDDQARITTMYTERAVQYIQKSRNRPFFLYLAHSMPHVPLAVSEKFKGKSKQGTYGDVMMEVDWSIGEIMKALIKKGLDKNTLIIFTSDNGPWMKFGNHAGSGGGFREGKMSPYEGGSRVPCIMTWKGTIPSGLICNQLTSTIDIFPTLANLVGAKLPQNKIDGINIMSILRGNIAESTRKYFYYYYNKNDLTAVRRDSWKLLLPSKGNLINEGTIRGKDRFPGNPVKKDISLALYDLANDPNERYDVKEQYPSIVEELLNVAEEARKELGDDLTKRKGSGDIRKVGTINK